MSGSNRNNRINRVAKNMRRFGYSYRNRPEPDAQALLRSSASNNPTSSTASPTGVSNFRRRNNADLLSGNLASDASTLGNIGSNQDLNIGLPNINLGSTAPDNSPQLQVSQPDQSSFPGLSQLQHLTRNDNSGDLNDLLDQESDTQKLFNLVQQDTGGNIASLKRLYDAGASTDDIQNLLDKMQTPNSADLADLMEQARVDDDSVQSKSELIEELYDTGATTDELKVLLDKQRDPEKLAEQITTANDDPEGLVELYNTGADYNQVNLLLSRNRNPKNLTRQVAALTNSDQRATDLANLYRTGATYEDINTAFTLTRDPAVLAELMKPVDHRVNPGNLQFASMSTDENTSEDAIGSIYFGDARIRLVHHDAGPGLSTRYTESKRYAITEPKSEEFTRWSKQNPTTNPSVFFEQNGIAPVSANDLTDQRREKGKPEDQQKHVFEVLFKRKFTNRKDFRPHISRGEPVRFGYQPTQMDLNIMANFSKKSEADLKSLRDTFNKREKTLELTENGIKAIEDYKDNPQVLESLRVQIIKHFNGDSKLTIDQVNKWLKANLSNIRKSFNEVEVPFKRAVENKNTQLYNWMKNNPRLRDIPVRVPQHPDLNASNLAPDPGNSNLELDGLNDKN